MNKQQWIRTQPCCIPNCCTCFSVEAAHIRTAENSGTSKKPSDDYLVPLCSFHHKAQHAKGYPHPLELATGRQWDRFEAKDWFLDKAKEYNKLYLKECFDL